MKNAIETIVTFIFVVAVAVGLTLLWGSGPAPTVLP